MPFLILMRHKKNRSRRYLGARREDRPATTTEPATTWFEFAWFHTMEAARSAAFRTEEEAETALAVFRVQNQTKNINYEVMEVGVT